MPPGKQVLICDMRRHAPWKASAHMRYEASRTWEKQWSSSGFPSKSRASYLTVCHSQLSVKQFPSAENGSPKQRPIFGIWFSNLIFLRFFFRLRSPLPSTILGHWELTRALDAFDFVVLRSCAGLRCLTPLVFLKLGIARHVGCALSAPNCEDRCGKSSTSCGDWSLCGKLQLKY